MAADHGIHHLRPVRPDPGLDAGHAFDAAVLDVGSNSVRLVIYRIEGRAIWTLFNEKVLAGLGRDASKGRGLSSAGVDGGGLDRIQHRAETA